MESIESLAYLEEIVEKLLVAMKNIKQEKLVLEARVESRDQEIAKMKDQLDSLQGERSQIQKRVAGLIDSIEKWEKINEAKIVDDAETTSQEIKEKKLF